MTTNIQQHHRIVFDLTDACGELIGGINHILIGINFFRKYRLRDSMVGFRPFAPRIHIGHQLPKFSVKFQVTRREQFHIADQLIPPIILDAIQTGAQGF